MERRSITISKSTTKQKRSHFTPHATLIGIGLRVQHLELFRPIEERVQIAQKVVKYTPTEKLLDALITILAGVCAINFPMFVLASAVGRSARFFLVAWLFRRFGPPIREFIERRFALVTLLGTILLVGGFVAFKYLLT